jgi:hypothetical protein
MNFVETYFISGEIVQKIFEKEKRISVKENVLYCTVRISGNNNRFAYVPISLNTWYHLVFILNSSSTPSVYLNNTLLTAITVGGSVADISTFDYGPTTNSLSIGTLNSNASNVNQANGLYTFNGYISKFGIYNKVLTQTEVNSLYNNGNG